MNLALPFPDSWFILAGSVFMIGFWCVLIAIISKVGGWDRIAKLYPAEEVTYRMADENTSKKFRWASLAMGPSYFPTNYGNCLTIVVSDLGIRLAVTPLIRTLHPPVLIPWSAIESCQLGKELKIFDRAAIQVRGVACPIRIFGRAAHAIQEAWTSQIALHAPRE